MGKGTEISAIFSKLGALGRNNPNYQEQKYAELGTKSTSEYIGEELSKVIVGSKDSEQTIDANQAEIVKLKSEVLLRLKVHSIPLTEAVEEGSPSTFIINCENAFIVQVYDTDGNKNNEVEIKILHNRVEIQKAHSSDVANILVLDKSFANGQT